MDKERWQLIQRLFEKALEVEEGERSRVLAEWCDGDADLLMEVSGMLYYSNTGSGLSQPINEKAFQVISTLENQIPSIQGPYTIQRLLAHGGMGSVYIAEQTSPVNRIVALKVVRSAAKDFISRFNYEHNLLAKLHHPHIAQVFDAGTTTAGLPYFTMEFVNGKSILNYCDEQKLTVHERLHLFIQACNGVEHAHRRGIIHRDLKPSNILIDVDGKTPVPKIIDFGIAHDINRVHLNQLPVSHYGTPAYMCPDAFSKDTADTTLDVYSLGVVLYELLCGFRPLSEKVYQENDSKRIFEAMKNREFPPPSIRIPDEECIRIADLRKTNPNQLKKELRGDLDAITLKALSPEQSRYRSIEAMIADLQNYFEFRPISAQPRTFLYLGRKLWKRNSYLASAITSFVMAILIVVLNLTISNYQVRKSQEQQTYLKEMVQKLIRGTTPFSRSQKKYLTVAAEVEKSLDGLEKDQFWADAHAEFARTLGDWLQYERAIIHYKIALDWYEKNKPDRVDIINDIRVNYLYSQVLQDGTAANFSLEEVNDLVDYFDATIGPNTRNAIASRRLVAEAYLFANQPQKASQVLEKIVLEHSHYPELREDIWSIKLKWGTVLNDLGECDRVLEMLTPVMAAQKQFFGANHPETIFAQFVLGNAYFKLGRNQEAKALFEETYNRRLLMYGPDNDNTLSSRYNYLLCCKRLKSLPADQLFLDFSDTLTKRQEAAGNNSGTRNILNSMADLAADLGDFETAKNLILEAIGDLQRVQPNVPEATLYRVTYAEILMKEKNWLVAESVLQEIAEELLIYNHPGISGIVQDYLCTVRMHQS